MRCFAMEFLSLRRAKLLIFNFFISSTVLLSKPVFCSIIVNEVCSLACFV